jgi:hypothetical protein
LESIVEFATEAWWLVPLSVFVFFASVAAVSAIAVRMPADYFRGERRERDPFPGLPPLVRRALHVSRQGLGVALIVVGILMLITPGQGLLTILIGLSLLDFKGRYALERRLVCQPPVLRTINWLRKKAGRAPLEL